MIRKIGVYIEFANNEQNISIQKIEAYEMEHEIAIARRAGSQLYYVSYMFKFNKKRRALVRMMFWVFFGIVTDYPMITTVHLKQNMWI